MSWTEVEWHESCMRAAALISLLFSSFRFVSVLSICTFLYFPWFRLRYYLELRRLDYIHRLLFNSSLICLFAEHSWLFQSVQSSTRCVAVAVCSFVPLYSWLWPFSRSASVSSVPTGCPTSAWPRTRPNTLTHSGSRIYRTAWVSTCIAIVACGRSAARTVSGSGTTTWNYKSTYSLLSVSMSDGNDCRISEEDEKK